MTELVMQAYNVLVEFKKHPFYLELRKLDQEIEVRHKELIDQFNEAKIKYDLVLEQGGKYHPDFKETIKTLSTIKAELYAKMEVQRYFELEQQFQALINEFLGEMANSISPYIQTPNKLNLLKKKGHHGGHHGN
ncbi:MAG: YlbF family regulator [Acholeplasmataceae bacterium]